MTTKVALYCRVSTTDQYPENQVRVLTDLAEKNGAEIVATFTVAFPQISRQIMMSKLKRSHANGTNQICRRVQVRGGQASYR